MVSVGYYDKETGEDLFQTAMVIFSIKFKATKPANYKKIKINLPWDIWLKRNSANLPYPVQDIEKQTKSKREKTVNTKEIRDQLKNQATDSSEMDTWTDEKLVKALDEAIERQGRKDWPEITSKIQMTDQGLISV